MHQFNPARRWRLVLAVGLLAIMGVAGSALTRQQAPPLAPAAGGPSVRDVPLPGGTESDIDRLRQAAQSWAHRYTYPSGQFDPRWLQQAAAQDLLIPRGQPAGQVAYNRATSKSPLALDPNAFTPLGPRPLDTNGTQFGYPFGLVAGRVNAIAVNPTNPAVAYIGSDGGGVWKTTNCCSAATTWTLTTDNPLINTTQISTIAVDPNNPNTVYAGTGDLQYNMVMPLGGSQGILKSTDAGASWTVVGADVFVPNIEVPWYTGPLKQAVGKVRVDPRNSNNVVAGTRHGLYFSYNAGASWSGPCFTNSFQNSQGQYITGLQLVNSGASTTIYAALGTANASVNGANAVYKTALPASGCPATASWSLLNNGWPAATGSGTGGSGKPGRIDLAVAPSNPQILYAQASSLLTTAPYQRGGQLGLWKTTDGGTTWHLQSGPTALFSCDNPPSTGDHNQGDYDQDLAVDPNNPNTIFMNTIEIFKSTDGGVTFTNLTCVYSGGTTVHPDQHALAYVAGSSNVLLAGNDGGIYASNNATAARPDFTSLNSTLNVIEFYSGDITGNFANTAQVGAVGGAQDNGDDVYVGSSSGPGTWHMPIGGDGFFARIDGVGGSASGGTWFVSDNGGQFWRSTTGPLGTYSRPNQTEPWRQEQKAFAMPFDIQRGDCAPSGCTHLIAGSNHVWESTDSGSTWTSSSDILTYNGAINQLGYARGHSDVAIAGTDDGVVAYGFGLGTGAAANWVDVSGGNAVLPNREILNVSISPGNPLVGYAAVGGFNEGTPSTPGHLFQVTCTANCASFTWVDKTGALPNVPLDSVVANPRYPQQVFAGSDWGLYFTNDITANPPVWQRFQSGIPNVMIADLRIDEGNTTLAAWTRSRGVYVWPLPNGPITPPSPNPTSPPGATATPTLAGPTVTPGGCTLSFSDVNPSDYFYTPVQYLACHGVISGYADGTFRPYANTTRGQMVKIIVNGFGVPGYNPPNGNTFADVPPSFPFFSVIEAAGHANIVSGYNCGGANEPCDAQNRPYFRPYANVNRGQLSKIVAAAAGWTLVTPANPTFADVGTGSPYYPFVETAVAHGVISGYGCGGVGEPCNGANQPYFRAFNSATRGQIAKIVYIALQAVPGPTNTPPPGPTNTLPPAPTNTLPPAPTNTPVPPTSTSVPPTSTSVLATSTTAPATATATATTCGTGNYSVTQASGVPIVAGITDLGNHTDDGVTVITLPFAYTLYDQSFTAVALSSNGNLQFNSTNTDYTNTCLPYSSFDFAIMPDWTDLVTNCSGCGIFGSISGSAPNRIVNLEWRAGVYQTSNLAHFEVRLYEGQRKFDVIYAQVDGGGINSTVGVQRDTGSLWTQVECNTGGLTSGLSLTFTQACTGVAPGKP